MSPPLHWLMLSCCSWCWRSRPWNGLSWDWRSGAGPAAWGGDWAWEEWYGGGVSTRESMKGTHCSSTPLSHTTHTFRDQRGRVQPREWQLQVCHWGQVLDEEEGPPHPLGVSEHQSHCTSYPQQPTVCEDQEGEKVKGSTKGYYTIQSTNLLPSCTLPSNLFLFTLLLSLPHSSSPS